jgi:hypothetical protein
MLTFKLNNQPTNAPLEWQDLEVQVDFTEQQQANITTDTFTFTLEASAIILNYIEQGRMGLGNGIFEGLPFDIEVTEQNNTLSIFNGHLDALDFRVLDDCKVQAGILKTQGYNSYYERMQANTFGYLRSQGVIQESDYVKIPYVVEKEFNFLELAFLSLATYMALKETIEAIKRTGEAIRDAIATASATPFVGGQLAVQIINVVLNLAYTVALIIYLKNLLTELINYIYPPLRYKKGIKVKTLLERATTYLGFSLDIANIPELERLYYYSSHTTSRKNILGGYTTDDQGIPQTADFGYRCSEVLDLVVKLFNCRVAIRNNTVFIRTESDPYWSQSSTYVLPDVLSESYRYNTEDLVANRLIYFQTDTNDSWTVKNFKGTNYEVITSYNTVTDKKKVGIKGLEQIGIELALGNRKDGLNLVESALKGLARILDVLVGTNLANDIEDRKGMLKVGSDIVNVPKLLYLNGSLKLDANHRDVFGAKALYTKYHSYKSFVLNNFGYQKKLYEEVTVPFCLHNFIELSENNYFTTQNGELGHIRDIKWRIGSDTAVISYYIFHIFTKNLHETYVEPE